MAHKTVAIVEKRNSGLLVHVQGPLADKIGIVIVNMEGLDCLDLDQLMTLYNEILATGLGAHMEPLKSIKEAIDNYGDHIDDLKDDSTPHPDDVTRAGMIAAYLDATHKESASVPDPPQQGDDQGHHPDHDHSDNQGGQALGDLTGGSQGQALDLEL